MLNPFPDAAFGSGINKLASFAIQAPSAMPAAPSFGARLNSIFGGLADAQLANDPVKAALFNKMKLPGWARLLGTAKVAYSGPNSSFVAGGNMTPGNYMDPEIAGVYRKLMAGMAKGMVAGGDKNPAATTNAGGFTARFPDARLIPNLSDPLSLNMGRPF